MELLTDSYLKAKAKNRFDLLQPKANRGDEDKDIAIFLTTTYNPAYNGLPNQVQKTWGLLGRFSSTRDLHSLKLKVGLRRPKNLRDILVESKFQPTGDETEPKKDESGPNLYRAFVQIRSQTQHNGQNHIKDDRSKIPFPNKGHLQQE